MPLLFFLLIATAASFDGHLYELRQASNIHIKFIKQPMQDLEITISGDRITLHWLLFSRARNIRGEAENYGAGMKNSTFVSFDGIFSDIAFNKIQGTRKLCHCTK